MASSDRVIVALDVTSYDDAARLVDMLCEDVSWFKIGSILFTREGPRICRLIKDAGCRVFLDLKYHDIPNTVYGAVTSALALDVDMLTLHASGGGDMLRRARDAADDAGRSDTILVAVTVLTHFDGAAFSSMFASPRSGAEMVLTLAAIARESGMTGVVASAHELPAIKAALGDEFVVVTPGIRLPGATKDDQTRVVTPEDAISDGADYIVVGRPIIAAPDPLAACRDIVTRAAGAEAR